MGIELDPDNPFEAELIKIAGMHRKKNLDYSGKSHQNQNFYDSAYQLGLTGGHSVESLISTKQARLRVLLPEYWNNELRPANEGIADTLLDRAVYSVIAMVIWAEGGYQSQSSPKEE